MGAGRRRGSLPAGPGRLSRPLAVALLSLVVVAVVSPGLALAEPGSPGVPQPRTRVYSEDFANTNATRPVSLGTYVGAVPPGQTYTADPAWLSRGCNGSIVRATMVTVPVGVGCTGSSWGGVRQLAWALGKLRGASDTAALQNYALSSFTQGDPGPGVVFATEDDIDLASANRFLVFTVDAMAENCAFAHPALVFSILNKAVPTPLGASLDPCAGLFSIRAPDIPGENGIRSLIARGGTLRSTEGFLYTGSAFGLQLRNEQGSGAGNDFAIDNLAVADATPQLDQAITPARRLVGDPATVTYTITNTDDLAAKVGWQLTNRLPTGLVVAGTASTTCSATEITAGAGAGAVAVVGRLNTGQSACTVTVPVTAPTPGTYVNEPADFTLVGLDAAAAASVTFLDDTPRLVLDKSADGPADANDNGSTDAGDTIDYAFAVRNSGNVGVTSLAIADGLLPTGIECDATSLAAGDATVCRGRYTLVDADLLAGRVVNSATAVGVGPGGVPVVSPASTATVDLGPQASLSIDKTADDPVDANDNGRTDAGDTISYRFAVDNTGDLPLSGVVVVDTLLKDTTVCAVITLGPTEGTTCSAVYTITQDDLDAGEVLNTATASGLADGDLVSAMSDRTRTVFDTPAALEIDKSADPPTDENGNDRTDAGDTIDYRFTVRNTGVVTIDEVDVDDDLITSGISCADTTLAPGEDTVCSGSYTITQTDVDGGSIDNRAEAVGATPGGTAITSALSNTTTTTTDDTTGLSFRQSASTPADSDDDNQISAGDRIGYSFVVGNTGAVTITDLTIDDDVLTDPADCGSTTLGPGETTTCTGIYRITQDDVDAGVVTNTANASGLDPGGSRVTSSEDSTETVVTAGSGVTLTKRAGPPDDVNGNGVTDRGDTIFYSFTVRNTGGVSLDRITVSDRRLDEVVCADSSLEPGQSTTCLAGDDDVITQADMDAGAVVNTATAAAEQPDGDVVRSPAATETTSVRVVRAVGLVQRPAPIEDVDGSGRDDAGDRISFDYTVVNTGTVSLTRVSVRAPLLTRSGRAVACPTTTLAPGGSVTCTSDPYVITAADVSVGTLVSVATASARTPAGDPLTSVASSVSIMLDDSEPPGVNPTAAPPPRGTDPPGSSGPPPGGSIPTPAPKSLSLWIPALALLLVVPEAVLLIWRYRRNQAALALAAARPDQPPPISIWMGR